jgi:hypothetical protein
MIEVRTCSHPGQSEARITKRYPTAAEASFQWRGADRMWHQGAGTTQDISAAGALNLAHDAPPLGAEVEVVVMLPAVRNGATAKDYLSENVCLLFQASPIIENRAAHHFELFGNRFPTNLTRIAFVRARALRSSSIDEVQGELFQDRLTAVFAHHVVEAPMHDQA